VFRPKVFIRNKYKLSINTTPTGRDYTGDWATGWQRKELTPTEIAAEIDEGHAVTAWYRDDYRDKEHFRVARCNVTRHRFLIESIRRNLAYYEKFERPVVRKLTANAYG
jgi:hypothetical protein